MIAEAASSQSAASTPQPISALRVRVDSHSIVPHEPATAGLSDPAISHDKHPDERPPGLHGFRR